jgi:hypothetical protein
MKDTYDLNDDAPRYVIEALIPVDRPLSSDDLADNYDPPKPNNLAELSNEYRDESGAVGRIGVEKDRSPQNLRMPTGIREHGRKPHQIREEDKLEKKLTLQPVRRHRRWAKECPPPAAGLARNRRWVIKTTARPISSTSWPGWRLTTTFGTRCT